MARLLHVFLLSLFLIATLLTKCDGQGARRNGEDNGQLDPVEPGMVTFTTRNNTNCDPEFRTFDGTCTNNVFRAAGTASTAQFSYFNTLSSTNAVFDELPSPRLISNVVCSQTEDIFNARYLSEFVTFFGQFLDHTIIATRVNPSEKQDIPIPNDDPIFANFSGFLKFERNERALAFTARGRNPSGNIERPINVLSSAIDLASVYGASDERALALRARRDGLMKTSSGNMLPLNEDGLFNAPSPSNRFFVAGDHRVNEHPVLTTLHTMFLREHNLLALDLKAVYPSWDDERLYQTARKINIAQFQKIVYEEFFPMLTGRQVRPYRRFRPNELPSVSVLFSTAAYRIGHTMVGNVITRRGPGMTPLPPVTMEDMFFRPITVLLDGIEPFLRGAIFQRAQEIDIFVHDALRNFLFLSVDRNLGFDLVALNLQRSRDHGLPSYNDVRQRFIGRRATSFADITSNEATQSRLSTAYGGSVDDIEAWVGLIAEDHKSGSSMGPTMFAIWNEEFSRLRDGDRFFYKVPNLFSQQLLNDFPRLRQIYSEPDTMAKIVLRNSDVTAEEIGSSVWTGRN